MNIVMAAYGLPRNSIENFMNWNQVALQEMGVTVWVGYHEYFINNPFSNLRVIKYPKKEKIFSIGRTVNYVMRRIDCGEKEIIIKTDPDIVFSKEVLNHISKNLTIGSGMVCICANIANPELVEFSTWSNMAKRRGGRGACFAMTKADWFKLNGYDERIEGWGGDDDEMFHRASKQVKITQDDEYPLFHVNHPERKNKFSNFPYNFYVNREIIKLLDWSSPNWGQAGQVEENK